MLPESPTILSNTSTERTLCIGYGNTMEHLPPPEKKEVSSVQYQKNI